MDGCNSRTWLHSKPIPYNPNAQPPTVKRSGVLVIAWMSMASFSPCFHDHLHKLMECVLTLQTKSELAIRWGKNSNMHFCTAPQWEVQNTPGSFPHRWCWSPVRWSCASSSWGLLWPARHSWWTDQPNLHWPRQDKWGNFAEEQQTVQQRRWWSYQGTLAEWPATYAVKKKQPQ